MRVAAAQIAVLEDIKHSSLELADEYARFEDLLHHAACSAADIQMIATKAGNRVAAKKASQPGSNAAVACHTLTNVATMIDDLATSLRKIDEVNQEIFLAKVKDVLSFCLDKEVNLVVLPEYSLPLECVAAIDAWLQNREINHPFCLVAGTHWCQRPQNRSPIENEAYERLRLNPDSLHLPRPMAPVYIREDIQAGEWTLIPKLAPSPLESAIPDYKFDPISDLSTSGWRPLRFNGTKIAILPCSDFGLQINDICEQARGRAEASGVTLLAVPALNPVSGHFHFYPAFERARKHRQGVIYANAACFVSKLSEGGTTYGHSLIYGQGKPVDILKTERSLKPDPTDPATAMPELCKMYRVPPRSEAVVTADWELRDECGRDWTLVSVAPLISREKYPHYANFYAIYQKLESQGQRQREHIQDAAGSFIDECGIASNDGAASCFRQTLEGWAVLCQSRFLTLPKWNVERMDFQAEVVICDEPNRPECVGALGLVEVGLNALVLSPLPSELLVAVTTLKEHVQEAKHKLVAAATMVDDAEPSRLPVPQPTSAPSPTPSPSQTEQEPVEYLTSIGSDALRVVDKAPLYQQTGWKIQMKAAISTLEVDKRYARLVQMIALYLRMLESNDYLLFATIFMHEHRPEMFARDESDDSPGSVIQRFTRYSERTAKARTGELAEHEDSLLSMVLEFLELIPPTQHLSHIRSVTEPAISGLLSVFYRESQGTPPSDKVTADQAYSWLTLAAHTRKKNLRLLLGYWAQLEWKAFESVTDQARRNLDDFAFYILMALDRYTAITRRRTVELELRRFDLQIQIFFGQTCSALLQRRIARRLLNSELDRQSILAEIDTAEQAIRELPLQARRLLEICDKDTLDVEELDDVLIGLRKCVSHLGVALGGAGMLSKLQIETDEKADSND